MTRDNKATGMSVRTAIQFLKRRDGLLTAGFVLLALLLGIVELADFDIWFHLRTGQLIWDRGEFPRTDWFSYSNADRDWINLHWGFELMSAGLWAIGGSAALIIAKSIVGATTFAIGLTATQKKWSIARSVGCWLAPLLLFSARYLCRPEILSTFFLVSTLALLFHCRRHPRIVWILPVIQLLWINVHSLFVLGWVVWIFFLIDALARRWFHQWVPESEQGDNHWKPWLAASGLMLLANLCNPYGWRGALFPFMLVSRIRGGDDREFIQQFAGEFMGIGDYISKYGLSVFFRYFPNLILTVVALFAVISIVGLLKQRRFSVFRFLLIASFAYLAWQATRNTVLFAIVAGLVTHWNVGDWFALRPEPTKRTAATGRFVLSVGIVLLIVSIPLGVYSNLRPLPSPQMQWRQFGLGEAEAWFPHAATEFLGEPTLPKRVLAMPLGYAYTCVFHNGPEQQVYAHPHFEVVAQSTFLRYREIRDELLRGPGNQTARMLLDDANGELLDVPAVLISRASCLPILANHEWRLVYFDNVAAVFVFEPQARELGIPPANR